MRLVMSLCKASLKDPLIIIIITLFKSQILLAEHYIKIQIDSEA